MQISSFPTIELLKKKKKITSLPNYLTKVWRELPQLFDMHHRNPRMHIHFIKGVVPVLYPCRTVSYWCHTCCFMLYKEGLPFTLPIMIYHVFYFYFFPF